MDNIILLDCDGVIVDPNPWVIAEVNKKFGTSFVFEDITDFKYTVCMSPEIGRWVLDHFYTREDLYDHCEGRTLEEIEAKLGIAELQKLARVIVVSATIPGHETSKMRFLHHVMGFSLKDIVFMRDKVLAERMAPGALLIEDAAHNLDVHVGPKIVMDRPWNRSWNALTHSNAIRAYSWSEIVVAARVLLSQ